MTRTEAGKLASLPKGRAEFIEPMDCASVPKLIDGPEWVYGVRRYVALALIGEPATCNFAESTT